MNTAHFMAVMLLCSVLLWFGGFVALAAFVVGLSAATGLSIMLTALGIGSVSIILWFVHIYQDAKPKDDKL